MEAFHKVNQEFNTASFFIGYGEFEDKINDLIHHLNFQDILKIVKKTDCFQKPKMMFKFKKINTILNEKIDTQKWEKLLELSPYGNPFQSRDFYLLFNQYNKDSATAIAIEDEYKNLIALCVIVFQKESGLKGFFSRRAIIYGGPIVLENDSNALDKLLFEIINYYKSKIIYLEFRNYFDYKFFDNCYKANGFKYVPWLNFHLDIQEIDLMKKAMSSSRLRQIKKAIKIGVTWQVAKSEQDVNSFYVILRDLYDNKIKKPLFPLTFFTEFYKQDFGKFLLVYYQNKVIGGIMCPIMPEQTIYEYYICGLDAEYKDQYPSVMATWAAMEYGAQHNIPLFDFMGAGSPEEEYGVREFKSRFGGRQVEHGRFLCINKPILYAIGKMGVKILKRNQ